MSIQSPRSPPPPLYTLRSSAGGGITALAFRPQEEKLVSGCSEGVISLWCLKVFRSNCNWKNPNGKGVIWLSCQNDAIYSQSRDGFIRKHGFRESCLIEESKNSFSSVGFCSCDIYSSKFIAVPEDDRINFVSTSDLHKVFDLRFPNDFKKGMCMCLKTFDPDRVKLVAGYEDGAIVVWDSRKPNLPMAEHTFYEDPVMCLDYNDFVKKGVCASASTELCTWYMDTGRFEKLQSLTVTNPGIASVKIRNDHKIFASGGWDGRLRIFSLKRLCPLAVLNHHADTVQCLEFNFVANEQHQINLLAAGSNDKRISLWSLY